MRTPLIIIGALVIAVIIVYFIARRRLADNMSKTLEPYRLEPGADRPYFEDRGVKYDEEKYAGYLRGYVGKLPDDQIDYFIAQRGRRNDVWNVRFCEALRAEKERRAAEKEAAADEPETAENPAGDAADGPEAGKTEEDE